MWELWKEFGGGCEGGLFWGLGYGVGIVLGPFGVVLVRTWCRWGCGLHCLGVHFAWSWVFSMRMVWCMVFVIVVLSHNIHFEAFNYLGGISEHTPV